MEPAAADLLHLLELARRNLLIDEIERLEIQPIQLVDAVHRRLRLLIRGRQRRGWRLAVLDGFVLGSQKQRRRVAVRGAMRDRR